MTKRFVGLGFAMLLVAAACGGGTGSSTPAGGSASSSSQPAASSSSSMATTSSTMAGEHVHYEDPVNDCLHGVTSEPAPTCMPEPTDILSVDITRASPLTIVIEIAEPGEPGFGPTYQFTIGLDLDLDPSTGITDFWPEFHGIGPDLESDYFGPSTDPFVQAYSITGQNEFEMLDPPPVEWTWLDDTHIQAVFDMEVVGDGSFGLALDLFTGDYYDHLVDGGHLVFPSGEVVLVE